MRRTWTQIFCACWVLAFWLATIRYEVIASARSAERHQAMWDTLIVDSLPPLTLLFVFLTFRRERYIGPGGVVGCISLALTSYLLICAYTVAPEKDGGWTFAMTIIYGYVGAFIAAAIALFRRG